MQFIDAYVHTNFGVGLDVLLLEMGPQISYQDKEEFMLRKFVVVHSS
jgi:hypothetical protein